MRRKRATVTTFLLLVGIVLACSVWWHAQQRQYALNRQLIAALVKGDDKQAFVLVNEGADPNTHTKAAATPTLLQILNQLLRRSPAKNNSPTALTLACVRDENGPVQARLVQAMLSHGACVNVQEENGWTPLLVAVGSGAEPDVIELLLKYGADANIKGIYGGTALSWARQRATQNSYSTVLKQGADLEIASADVRRIWFANADRHTDLDSNTVALLRYYGARK